MAARLGGKRALITGASRGIGLAIAQAFAREGASLALNARNPDRLAAVADDVSANAIAYPCDVTDREAVFDMVRQVEADGPIDILVNNAGIHIARPFTEYTFEEFSTVIEANLYSVFHVTQAVLPGMKTRQSGAIVNIASTAGRWGSRNQSAYNASKHAVMGITRCLALEMAPLGIRTNAICPWVVDTDMADGFIEGHAAATGMTREEITEAFTAAVPIKRFVKPEEVAALAVYLASDESAFVNGQGMTIDAGYTLT
ncbi:MAG: SDR family NAD(P)-dependent oxidoreductase [Gammaproteobacteria bacterium]